MHDDRAAVPERHPLSAAARWYLAGVAVCILLLAVFFPEVGSDPIWAFGIAVVLICPALAVMPIRHALDRQFRTIVQSIEDAHRREGSRAAEWQARFAERRILSRSPVLGWIGRRVVAEGWPGLLLLLAVIVGVVLRAYGAGELRFYDDEYILLYDARQYFDGAPVAALRERGLWLSTMPAIWSSQLFGASAFSLRLPGIVLNALGAVPLYLLLRRVHRPLAACTALLWAINPWMVGVSRNLREYAAFPLFYAWTGVLLVDMVSFLRRAFGLTVRRWRSIVTSMAWRVGALALPLWYAYTVDPKSTFRSVVPLYGAAFFLLLLPMRRRVFGPQLQRFLHRPLGVALLTSSVVLAVVVSADVLASSFDPRWILLFFGNAPQQVYFERSLLTVYLGIAVTLIAVRFVRSVSVWFALTSVGVYLFTYVVVFERYFRPRYAIAMQVWMIMLTAVALYLVYRLLAVPLRRRSLSALVVVALTVNLPHVVLPSVQFRSGYFPVTDEYHYETDAAFAYVHERLQPNDGLITTMNLDAGLYAQYGTKHEPTVMYEYFFAVDGREQVAAQVRHAPRGWILLDVLRNGEWIEGLPHAEFSVDGTVVRYIGLLGDIHVYTWGTD